MLRPLRLLGVSALLAFSVSPGKTETRLYIADHNVGKIIKIQMDGTLLWDAPNRNGHDVQVLPNGNVLIVNGPVVQEVAPDRRVVSEIGKPLVESAESAQRLPNGHTVIADNARHCVIELDRNNKVVWRYEVPNKHRRPHPTMRQMRRLPNGNTLICASTEDEVIEVNRAGKVVWRYFVPFPYLAERLPNGHTLISSGDGYGSPQGFFVVEVDKDDNVVWQYGGVDAPADQKLDWPSGFARLANGNTLIAEARGAQIREVAPDKSLVRIIRSPAMQHPATIVAVEEP